MLTDEAKLHSNGNKGLSIRQSHGIACVGMLDGVLSQICSGRSRVKIPAIEAIGISKILTGLFGHLTVMLVELLFMTASQLLERQILAPGIPIARGSDFQHAEQSLKRFIHDGKSMLAEGYRDTKGGFFYVPSNCGERLMLPAKYLEELKTAPINEVDCVTTFIQMFEGEYTTALSEKENWVEACIVFAIEGFHGAQKIEGYSHILRPIAYYFLSKIRPVAGHYAEAEKAAIPILEARQKAGGKALDLLYWMPDQARGSKRDMTFITTILLKISLAAIHTNATAPSQLTYDLCTMPEYVEPLRKEAPSVLGPDGNIDKKSFGQLVKLDSSMKESQRFNPLLLITFERVVHRPYRLSDGFVIPPHTHIGVPTSSLLMDPDLYPDPTRYDGFRFVEIRTREPNADARA